MNRRDFLLTTAVAVPASLFVSQPTAAQLSGGIDELTREVGFTLEISVQKAVAATGAALYVARETLSSLEFTEVKNFLPGTDRLFLQAANVIGGALPKTMKDLPAIMEKLALPPESASRLTGFILDYLGRNGGRKAAGLLRKAWKS